MNTSRFAGPLLVLLALAGCDDASTSTGSSMPSASTSGNGFEGTWLHHEGSEIRDLLRFQGNQVRHESYLKKCQLSQTEGSWTLQGQILLVTPAKVWTRYEDSDAQDSASACAYAVNDVQVTGTLPMELANVTASSFDWKSRRIDFNDTGSTVTVILEHFVRQ